MRPRDLIAAILIRIVITNPKRRERNQRRAEAMMKARR